MLKTSMKQIIMRFKRWLMLRKHKVTMNKKKKADSAKVVPDIEEPKIEMFKKKETRKAKRRRLLADLLAQQTNPCTILNCPLDTLSYNEVQFRNEDLQLREIEDPHSVRRMEREF